MLSCDDVMSLPQWVSLNLHPLLCGHMAKEAQEGALYLLYDITAPGAALREAILKILEDGTL